MKKNILISVYEMEIGGIERSLINMLENFDYKNYNVDLLIFNHTGDFLSLIPKDVNILQPVKQYSTFRKPVMQCLREGQFFLSIIRVLSKSIAHFKAKHRNLEEGSGYIQMQLAIKYSSSFLPRLKKKYHMAISYAWPHDIVSNKVNADQKIAWIHTDYSKLEIDNNIDLTTWSKFDYIASISDECTKAFVKQYPSLKRRIFLMENITSAEFVRKMAEEQGDFSKNQNETFQLVSVGRLSYVKGFDMAVEALKLLHEKGYTNIKWTIVGYGGYEAQLQDLIKKNEMQDSFTLVGKQSNPYPYINRADLYVQPSRYEGKAVTVTEAQILAKPVIVTNYPTAPSQIKNGYDGYICELSAEGIAEGIERLYKDERYRETLSENCAYTDFSNTSELKKLYKLINKDEIEERQYNDEVV